MTNPIIEIPIEDEYSLLDESKANDFVLVQEYGRALYKSWRNVIAKQVSAGYKCWVCHDEEHDKVRKLLFEIKSH